jgi:hypothetical protein
MNSAQSSRREVISLHIPDSVFAMTFRTLQFLHATTRGLREFPWKNGSEGRFAGWLSLLPDV